MNKRLMTVLGTIAIAVSLGLYVVAHEIPEQPNFSPGDTLLAEDLNTMVGGIQSNADAIDSLSSDTRGSGVTAIVHEFGNPDGTPVMDPMDIEGSSGTLWRTTTGISAVISTSELPAGAYSVWWVIFNNPEHCATPNACGADDLGDRTGDGVQASLVWATGAEVLDDGIGTFRAHLPAGASREALWGPGLQNLEGAEIHAVIRYHGPVIPEIFVDQITTVGGGCDEFNQPTGCYDPQAIAFVEP